MRAHTPLVRLVLATLLGIALIGPLSLTGPFEAPRATALTYIRVSSLATATRVNYLTIPRLRISRPVREGNPLLRASQISTSYVYHYPGTSWPGGHSNTYLYAHAQVGAFVNLKYVVRGDIVNLRLLNGLWLRYRVTAKYNVAWNAVRWLYPTISERLTLQTCLGAGPYARKLIVTAVPAY